LSVFFSVLLCCTTWEGNFKNVLIWLEFEIENKIFQKFKEAGAISEDSAVSEEAAKLDIHEQFWLEYFNDIFLEN